MRSREPHAPSLEGVKQVAQAMGMVSVQADCTLDEALILISDRGIANRCTAYEIAARVVDGTVRFDRPTL